VVNLVAHMIDKKEQDFAVEAAISKVYASEVMFHTADEALQIAGGLGFMRELPYERVLRDCRINRIFEGTNEVLRLFIALTAMSDVGSSLQELAAGLKGVFNEPIKGFGVLSGYALRQASLRTGIARDKCKFTLLHASLAAEAQSFEESATRLAQATDRILRKHGRNIIGKQFASRRLADIMIDLFVFAAVLSRVDTALVEKKPAEVEKELTIARAFSYQAKLRIAANFAQIDENEDELIKTLADHAVTSEGYPWDVI
jgi:alkylation response protein AidB-like acyl-CoA dehydrogenase